jgi:hydroxyacyl-ACP dehydratase HTD2-like protein with hotdog domain
LVAKKAFEHKKKRFARELNAETLNTHLESINDGRLECEHCGRRFNQNIFEKHSSICEKVFIRKRKTFNAQKQRAVDEEHYKWVEAAQ